MASRGVLGKLTVSDEEMMAIHPSFPP